MNVRFSPGQGLWPINEKTTGYFKKKISRSIFWRASVPFSELNSALPTFYCSTQENAKIHQANLKKIHDAFLFAIDGCEPRDILKPTMSLFYRMALVDAQSPIVFNQDIDIHIECTFYPLVLAVKAIIINEKISGFRACFLEHFKSWISEKNFETIPIRFVFTYKKMEYAFILDLKNYLNGCEILGEDFFLLRHYMEKTLNKPLDEEAAQGIHNIGNSCYINSVLQALFSMTSIRNNLSSDYLEGMNHECNCLEYTQEYDDFKRLIPLHEKIIEIYKTPNRDELIHELRDLLFEMVPFLQKEGIHSQQDAADIVDTIMKAADSKVYLQQTTRGNFLDIDYESVQNSEAVQMLSLPLVLKSDTPATVEDPVDFTALLDDFMNNQVNDPQNAWKPAYGVEIPQYLNQRKIVYHTPNLLAFHIKRFQFSIDGTKLQRKVRFPVNELIDMKKYVSKDLLKDQNSVLFRLKAIVIHSGGARLAGGHFFTQAIRGGSWHELNDERCHKISSNEVQREQAYMAFFERVYF